MQAYATEYIRVYNDIVENVSLRAAAVYGAVERCAEYRDGELVCAISQPELSSKTGVPIRVVWDDLQRLMQAGYLEHMGRANQIPGRPNIYKVNRKGGVS